MAVNISESHHPGGVPSVGDGVDIDFGSVRISLGKNDYHDMVDQISNKVGKDLKILTDLYDKYWDRVKQTYKVVEAIRSAFYDGEGEYYVRRSEKDIDWGKIEEILSENNSLLGFE